MRLSFSLKLLQMGKCTAHLFFGQCHLSLQICDFGLYQYIDQYIIKKDINCLRQTITFDLHIIL